MQELGKPTGRTGLTIGVPGVDASRDDRGAIRHAYAMIPLAEGLLFLLDFCSSDGGISTGMFLIPDPSFYNYLQVLALTLIPVLLALRLLVFSDWLTLTSPLLPRYQLLRYWRF